jgi:2-methylcitrate dehydratase PrpD
MSVLGELARFTEEVSYDSIPDTVRETAKVAILDTIGVALAAVREPIAAVLREYSMANGAEPVDPEEAISKSRPAGAGAARDRVLSRATVIGLGLRGPPAVVALLNGALAHALDFDDISDTMGGHPSVPMLPAALALAETTGASGKELISAYVAGYEVETKIAKGLNFMHYEAGWHPTSTLGVFGATAASSKLLKLDKDATERALAIACSMSAGIKGNFGSMMKPFQVGQAAQSGVVASQAASLGMTASPNAFEGRQGFAEVYNGPDNYDLRAIVETLADPWDLYEPGLVIKQYPCCGSTHPVVDAALALRSEHLISPEEIDSIEVWLHPRRLRHTDRPDPRGGLESKFSVQYAAAIALAEGEVRLRHFADDALEDPMLRSLLGKITAKALPEERWGPEHFAGEAQIRMHDGKQYFRRVEKAKGRGTRLALSRQEVDAKFIDCATRALSPEQADRLLSQLRQLERAETIVGLSAQYSHPNGAVTS